MLTVPFIVQNECCQIPANERDDMYDEGKIGSISFGNLPKGAVVEIYRGTAESGCGYKWHNTSRRSYRTGWCVPVKPLAEQYPLGLSGTFFELGAAKWIDTRFSAATSEAVIRTTRPCTPINQRRTSLSKRKSCQTRALPTIFAHNLDGSVWVKFFDNMTELETYERTPIHNVSSLFLLRLCVPCDHQKFHRGFNVADSKGRTYRRLAS